MTPPRDVLITGGTGYIGRRLTEALLARGHRVRLLARPGSEGRVPAGAEVVFGNALDSADYRAALRLGDTVVHLIGTPHPAPWKGEAFRKVDLPSIQAGAAAARQVPVAHFVYLSVAQPAPIMRSYIAVRAEGERLLREAGLPATFLRPWYVLGPGHRWPLLFLPVYALLERLPATRDGARRMGLVTLEQMVGALVAAVEHPPAAAESPRVVDVPGIRAGG